MNSNSCSDSSNESMVNPPYIQMNFGQQAQQQQSHQHQQQQQERYVWEMRTRSPNVTPASTVLNSPDLNGELSYVPLQGLSPSGGGVQGSGSYGSNAGRDSGGYYYQRPQLHQIRLGRSPGSQFETRDVLPQGLASPGSPTDVGKADGQCLRDGEIVVFDDIDTNWMNKASSGQRPGSNEDVLKVTKMIGQLPIAEYEGSPRRFGSQPNTNTITMGGPRKRPPGFPQRVSPTTSAANNATAPAKASVGNLIDLVDHEEERSGTLREKTPTFDYLYEFSETRKVLEEFFKANPEDEKRYTDYTTESGDDVASSPQEYPATPMEQAYIGQRLARIPKDELYMVHRSPTKKPPSDQNPATAYQEHNDIELYIDSNSRSSGDLADTELEANLRRHSRNFTLSPETTDYDSNCGDLDSLSNDINCPTDFGKLYTSMPVLEDGLSSGHASDTENNASVVCDKQHSSQSQPVHENNGNGERLDTDYNVMSASLATLTTDASQSALISDFASLPMPPAPPPSSPPQIEIADASESMTMAPDADNPLDSHYGAVYAAALGGTHTEKSAGSGLGVTPVTGGGSLPSQAASEIQEAMKEIRSALQRAKTQPEKLKFCDEVLPTDPDSPVWVPRKGTTVSAAQGAAADEEPDTDLETDRLLGQQRHDEQDFFADQTLADNNANEGTDIASNGHLNGTSDNNNPNPMNTTKPQTYSTATIRQGIGTSLTPNSPDICQIVGTTDISISSPEKLQFTKSPTGSIKSLKDSANSDKKAKSRNKEGLLEPKVLIEGVLFRARYLGSTQLVCEGQPTKSTRMMQAEEAVSRIKALAPEGESQPSTEVDLFISTEKIMVLNTDLKEIMMDHALRTISYIADIGDLVVLMARRRFVPNSVVDPSITSPLGDVPTPGIGEEESPPKEPLSKHNRTPKMICHVFESDEAQFIAQSIGQAFQVAYMEFLKANGIENESLAKEMDYQEVLNSQEIFGDELEIFAKKELQKEVVVPKAKGEILGVVIVESGWGSMLPTVVIANLMSSGAAARCGQLNIGDQLIAINGMSLVGLPLSTCQSYIRNAKNQTAVKFTVVPCPPVVEVKILRPKALFQLGFSVQNGVICSLLRGGIAERGGVRVGHRIIEINNQSVVAVPHDTIVKLLSSSVGEILMKTMPTSMFRLLTGQETPIYI
ncbi:uncharacterized protein LOC6726282 isoform X2 [Drosophila simulans]|uniref:uncharacterized protein LOC6726282 isoform X2 n=1 Tax=Drosophila simulans TaxID=7240 RepID=UPI00078AE039|nr:uncharacterized protein LOC6726282 isoform X2 [Drosophila simulans]KMZ10348.1 uncharacterized protein Dsimw501_GD15674, isoform B [Drosophila simulans]